MLPFQLRPTHDLLFKKLLTSEDSTYILRNFVKDLLGIEFKTLTPKKTYHIDSYKESFEKMTIKLTEVDILAVDEEGSHYTIECQIQPHHYFQERAIFYLTEAYRSSFGNQEIEAFIKDNNFSALRPAYGINIVDFHVFDKEQEALQIFRLLNEKTYQPFLGFKGKEPLILSFLSLKNKHLEKNHPAYHWQYFLKTGEVRQEAPSYIKEAKEKIDYYQLDEEEKTMIMRVNKAEESFNAKLSTRLIEAEEKVRREGREEVREEVHEEAQLKWEQVARENVVRMLKDQMPIEKISEYSSLSLEAIKKIKYTHMD